MLRAKNNKGRTLLESATTNVRAMLAFLHKARMAKYLAYFEQDTRERYHVYWSPITKRRYRVIDGEETNFTPVEGPLYHVGYKYGKALTIRIKATSIYL